MNGKTLVSLSIYIYNTRDEKGERGVRAEPFKVKLKKAGFLFFLIFLGFQNLSIESSKRRPFSFKNSTKRRKDVIDSGEDEEAENAPRGRGASSSYSRRGRRRRSRGEHDDPISGPSGKRATKRRKKSPTTTPSTVVGDGRDDVGRG